MLRRLEERGTLLQNWLSSYPGNIDLFKGIIETLEKVLKFFQS